MSYNDWRYPQRPMLDVPIHRQSIGAMSMASGSRIPTPEGSFKPYVYRGKGFDQYEVEVVAVVSPPKPKKRRRRPSSPKQDWGRLWDTRPRLHYRPELPDPPYAPSTARPKTTPDHLRWATKQRTPAHLRPSVGWQPMKGSDIDSILSEFDLED